eukprot:PhF_6_TR29097/c0_g1_i2/m.42438
MPDGPYDVIWVVNTLGKLMVFSGTFSFFSDIASQGMETCTRRRKRQNNKDGPATDTQVDAAQQQTATAVEGATSEKTPIEGPSSTQGTTTQDGAAAGVPAKGDERTCGTEFQETYDFRRTARYALVHVCWNAPTHLPRLMIINSLFPGPITFQMVVKKMLLNELVFSPIEALGVMTLVTTFKDGTCANVPDKIRKDYPTFQIAKYIGHIPAHIVMFSMSTNIMNMMMINYTIKFIT